MRELLSSGWSNERRLLTWLIIIIIVLRFNAGRILFDNICQYYLILSTWKILYLKLKNCIFKNYLNWIHTHLIIWNIVVPYLNSFNAFIVTAVSFLLWYNIKLNYSQLKYLHIWVQLLHLKTRLTYLKNMILWTRLDITFEVK